MSDTNQDNNLNLEPIVNKVAQSGLVTISLEDYLPTQKVLALDVKDFLFQGLLLREKEFRQHLKEFDWNQFNDAVVAVHCSTDALVQQWAYMLISEKLQQAAGVYLGTATEVTEQLLLSNIKAIDANDFADARVMVRGCGDKRVTAAAYLEISNKLLPVVKSLFYGEVCSNVPIYKRAKMSRSKGQD